MNIPNLQTILLVIQHSISLCGALVILAGVMRALIKYVHYSFKHHSTQKNVDINQIRLNLGLVLALGLEFIIAADLIGTTTAPDYYSVGMVAAIVFIRTRLSYTLDREINALRNIESCNTGK